MPQYSIRKLNLRFFTNPYSYSNNQHKIANDHADVSRIVDGDMVLCTVFHFSVEIRTMSSSLMRWQDSEEMAGLMRIYYIQDLSVKSMIFAHMTKRLMKDY